jgi:hemolysin III
MMKKMRDPFSALSHLAGAVAALPGVYMLLEWGGSTLARTVSLLVYGASLFGLFFASGVYHAAVAAPKTTEILRKIDHAAIYLLIAGTYTPFCIIAFSGFWKWGMLALIWSLALVGIGVKLFTVHAPRWFSAGVYLIMGWLSVFAVSEILRQLSPAAMGWLVAGGILYTLGAVVYITKKGDFFPGVFGFHEIWHIFVLLAAAAHFAAVANLL